MISSQPKPEREQPAALTHEDYAAAPLRNLVHSALEMYFADLDGHLPNNVYQLVMTEVEIPLLQCVMHHCGGNQSKAAAVLGINRGTLRKKLKHYGLEK